MCDRAERKSPSVGENVYIAPTAVVVGDVKLEKEANVWYQAVVRADDAPIHIGAQSNIQDNVTLHVDAGYSIEIGEGCSIGHNAVLHGCIIGDNTLIGMGAIVLNGATIGKNCLIGAGALVTQHKTIPDNSLVLGSPGKVVRTLTPDEIRENAHNASAYVSCAAKHASGVFAVLSSNEP